MCFILKRCSQYRYKKRQPAFYKIHRSKYVVFWGKKTNFAPTLNILTIIPYKETRRRWSEKKKTIMAGFEEGVYWRQLRQTSGIPERMYHQQNKGLILYHYHWPYETAVEDFSLFSGDRFQNIPNPDVLHSVYLMNEEKVIYILRKEETDTLKVDTVEVEFPCQDDLEDFER